MLRNYQLGLLHFIHLLICADGVTEGSELDAFQKIKIKENIPETTFQEFEAATKSQSERELYQNGIAYLTACSDDEKLRVFSTLYQLSEIDGRVHTKEIRLLMYSVKTAGIEFNQVVDFAKENPPIF